MAELVPARKSAIAEAKLAQVPRLVAPNPQTAKRFIEYFAANIRNPNTRRAYVRAILEFSSWCEAQNLNDIVDIEPVHVAAFIEQLGYLGWQSRRLSRISPPSGCCSIGSSSARSLPPTPQRQFVAPDIPSRRARPPF